jgi:superfamily II DNA helicase RecQ
MSKKDANALSDSLNNAGLPSLWLTSELNSQRKTHVMKSWEEGPEKVLVSTFVDGIDNASTEDVIIVGATHSIYSLVQAVGRIRPPRQNMDRAAIHIFHSDSYVRYNSIEVDDNVSRTIGAGILGDESSRDEVTKYYNSKFTSVGYKKWMEQQSCLRKVLFMFFHIKSDACGHCSNCTKNNTITISANTAKKSIHNEKGNIATVLDALEVMANVCYVCRQYNCNGIQCRTSSYNICYCCHAMTKSNYHSLQTCAVARQPAVQTMSQSCSSCYMAMSSHIPNRGALDQHRNNQCPLQKRVKRVLLFGVEGKLDQGVSARRVLASTLSDQTSWFTAMSQNIKLIDDHRRLGKKV